MTQTPAPILSALAEAAAGAEAPAARQEPRERSFHGDVFTDRFEWMREKESPELRRHLEAENAYTDAVAQPLEGLRTAVFGEIKARTKETDLSVPQRMNGYWYFSRTVEGQQYRVHCRVAAQTTGNAEADWTPPVVEPGVPVEGEEVILDGNALAEGQPFFSLGGLDLSEDGRWLAYSVDNAGDERYTIRVKDLSTGELLPDEIPGTMAGLVLSPDASELYYLMPDESWRPYRLFRHRIGSDAPDALLFEEPDVSLWTGMGLSSDKRELLIEIGNSEVSEIRTLPLTGGEGSPATDDDARPRVLIPREAGLLASADAMLAGGEPAYLITHNRDGANNAVALATAAELEKPWAEQSWIPVVEHRDTVKVDGAGVTERWVLVSRREDTVPAFAVFPREQVEALAAPGTGAAAGSGAGSRAGAAAGSGAAGGTAAASAAAGGTAAGLTPLTPDFEEEMYSVSAGSSYESPFLTLHYVSYVTPERVIRYDPATGSLATLKETEVPNADLSAYEAVREWATAADGTRIPVSIVKRKDTPRDGTAPAVVYGYGSYEASMDPRFSAARLSVLDRGVLWVTAHVRGGGELGRAWYTDGKKLSKKNTFTDFVDVTRWLAAEKWADGSRLAAMGGSAGGLLMGVVVNLAPELYRAVVAQVPFVDALTTILDPNLPLSALEWEEWGNPITEPEVYAYMKSYSPYENVKPARLPAVAAVTSLNDTRVLYVEPAKWVQVLRENQEGEAPIVLKTEMDGGHGGASGRYEGWKDYAWDVAWLLGHLDAVERVDG
ncbi:S9 family peptidase [Arthrobacter sp. UM1]|uniref:S9 family peptidase n=1 Tax=Arthrobacter sp. UM1 TaxID=2766776 RepID=UPI001CF6F792|nr:S9 family peptidase [Arthrobacter sp. UM1]MCB4208405.1 S9 family peptidase [Arthrobacter sp. UM1]